MIKAENIASKEFRKALYGYDCEQVDRYLDELIVQLKQMEQERAEMASTIEYLVSLVQQNKTGPAETEEIVTPVSPHELLTNTDRRNLKQGEADSAEQDA